MRRATQGVLSLAAAAVFIVPTLAEEPARPAAPPSAPTAAVSAVLPAAHVTIEKDVIDLGEVARGAKAEASFVLHNGGTTPVKILSAKPG